MTQTSFKNTNIHSKQANNALQSSHSSVSRVVSIHDIFSQKDEILALQAMFDESEVEIQTLYDEDFEFLMKLDELEKEEWIEMNGSSDRILMKAQDAESEHFSRKKEIESGGKKCFARKECGKETCSSVQNERNEGSFHVHDEEKSLNHQDETKVSSLPTGSSNRSVFSLLKKFELLVFFSNPLQYSSLF